MLIINNQSIKNALKYIKKQVSFIFVLLIVAVGVFNIAFNHSRIRVFVNDAMVKRAQIILDNEETDDLQNYFNLECIEKDEYLNSKPYEKYSVTKFDHELEIEMVATGWIMPKRATVYVKQSIEDIRGQYKGSKADKGDLPDVPFDFEDMMYKVKMKKQEGRWYIVSLKPVRSIQ